MSEKYNSEVLNVIHSRKSVRHFTGDIVKKTELRLLVRAAMSAPSSKNNQPWEFILTNDRLILDKLGDGLPYAKMLYKAGGAIIVCAVPEKATEKKIEYAIIDVSAACENILLAAEAIGLGAVWTAVYPQDDRMKFTSETLNIPANVIPFAVIPVGYPSGVDLPKDKFNPKVIHTDKW
jgi:nitroreductase